MRNLYSIAKVMIFSTCVAIVVVVNLAYDIEGPDHFGMVHHRVEEKVLHLSKWVTTGRHKWFSGEMPAADNKSKVVL